jgi:hypothetical protein
MLQTNELPPNLDTGSRKRKPPKRFVENSFKNLGTKKRKTKSTPSNTQSSTSTSSRKTHEAHAASASPPCAQPHIPEDTGVTTDDDDGSKNPDTEPIEVSDSDDDGMVEVIEHDDEELSEYGYYDIYF